MYLAAHRSFHRNCDVEACKRLQQAEFSDKGNRLQIFIHFLRPCQDRSNQVWQIWGRICKISIELPRKAPTIQDVAKFAKVSTATVSRALSAPDRVSAKTRERVETAVRATGYTINLTARSLRKQSGHTIVVALPNVGNTFFTPIVDAIERTASSRGYSVVISNRSVERRNGGELAEYFRSNRADGLLLFDGTTDIAALRTVGANIGGFFPTVVVCEAIPHSMLPTVKSDNRAASHMAVQHLIELGHRQIAHLAAPRYNVLYYERVAGMQDALEAAGLHMDPCWELAGDFSLESGVAAARKFLTLAPRPTAIFCASDNMAVGFVSELRRHDIECPRDVSVVGFDDIPLARHFWPRLTTVRQQQSEMGRAAAEMLLNSLSEQRPLSNKQDVVLSCDLIVRDSTRRLEA